MTSSASPSLVEHLLDDGEAGGVALLVVHGRLLPGLPHSPPPDQVVTGEGEQGEEQVEEEHVEKEQVEEEQVEKEQVEEEQVEEEQVEKEQVEEKQVEKEEMWSFSSL